MKFIKSRDIEMLTLYKAYRNKVTYELRIAKKTYYNCFFNNDIAKRRDLLWKTPNNMLNVNHTCQINELTINGTNYSGEEQLANALKSYFVSLVGNNSHCNIPKALHHMQTIKQNPPLCFLVPDERSCLHFPTLETTILPI